MTYVLESGWKRFSELCTERGYSAAYASVSEHDLLMHGTSLVNDELFRAAVRDVVSKWMSSNSSHAARVDGYTLVPLSTTDTTAAFVIIPSDQYSESEAQWVKGLAAMRGEVEHLSLTSEQLTDRLVLNMEEQATLLRLCETLSASVPPVEFAQAVCRELLRGVPYEWSAAAFQLMSDGASCTDEIASAGAVPISSMDTVQHIIDTVSRHVRRGNVALLEGDACVEIASGCEQILAYVLQENGVCLGTLILGRSKGRAHDVSNIDIELLSAAGSMLIAKIGDWNLRRKQEQMFVATVETVVLTIEAKDPYTSGHASRVGYLSEQIAEAIGWNDAESERARLAGLFHDVGKVGICDTIVRAPGRLTDEQYDHMKLHPEIGHHMLSGLPGLDDILPAVLHHHERMDGNGYPHGLSGEDIPLIARIVCLADAFDAMSSDRLYRAKMSRQSVMDELDRCAGTHFDPYLVDAFRDHVSLHVFDSMIRDPQRFTPTPEIIQRAQTYFQTISGDAESNAAA